MAYQAASIGQQGLSLSSYTDIRDYLLQQYQTIYGQSAYLATDSADYQFISLIALMMSDTQNGLQLAYNSRSPLTAVGAALDALLKLNGIARKVASYSTCQVTLNGTAGTTIVNGVVADQAGYKWDLPTPVTIPASGSIIVTATCETAGAISADIGTITAMDSGITAGWLGVTNAVVAVPGQPIEQDSTVRARQAISTELPSITMLAGTQAAVAAVAGVKRYNILENYTSSVDTYGNPPHSVTCVVEGGTDLDVATAIFNNRGIGPLTNGTTSVIITDPTTGASMQISFMRPTYINIYATLGIHPLVGYTSVTGTVIQAAIAAYLNSLQIGESLTISGLYAAAMSVMSNISMPLFSVRSLTAGLSVNPTGTADISINFNQVTQGSAANVVINTV